MYTVIVTGSRHYKNNMSVYLVLNNLKKENPDLFVKVGDCPTGADKFTKDWYLTSMTEYKEFKADWDKYGGAAGPIRNHEMVDSGGDLCVAFPDDDTRGTKDCAEYAHESRIPVWFPDLPAWAQWAAPIAQYRND